MECNGKAKVNIWLGINLLIKNYKFKLKQVDIIEDSLYIFFNTAAAKNF